MTRRFGWAVLALLVVLVAYPAFLIARAKFFPKRYQVQSIALRPEYQDAALLERAWTLPVAARFGHTLESQRNVSACGLASAANVFRSLGTGPTTASSVVEGTGKCRMLGYCWNGLTLDELADVIRSKTDRKVTVLRDLTLAEFRAQVARANDSGCAHRELPPWAPLRTGRWPPRSDRWVPSRPGPRVRSRCETRGTGPGSSRPSGSTGPWNSVDSHARKKPGMLLIE